MAVLHAKTDAMFASKSNSTPAKRIISRLCKSAGLIIIYNVAILLVMIRAFSYDLN